MFINVKIEIPVSVARIYHPNLNVFALILPLSEGRTGTSCVPYNK
jgi:hypothetical protein